MGDIIAQIGATVCGCIGIWMVGRPEQWRKWGFLIGLCGQPFWFYTLTVNKQYIILLMTFWYTYSWGQGAYFNICKEGKK